MYRIAVVIPSIGYASSADFASTSPVWLPNPGGMSSFVNLTRSGSTGPGAPGQGSGGWTGIELAWSYWLRIQVYPPDYGRGV
jgi:hypothetical protein